MINQLSRSQTETGHVNKTVGTCPVCHIVCIRLTQTGRLYNHGPRSGQCAGAGTLPLSAVNMNTGILSSTQHVMSQTSTGQPLASTSSLTSLTSSSQSVLHPWPTGALPPSVKWIPRPARQRCATLLTKLMLGVINKPTEVEE